VPEPPAARATSASIAQAFDHLIGAEIDSSFAQIKLETGRPPAPAADTTPTEEVGVLFEELAANHMRPVRDFLIDLRCSEASRDWLDVCEPAVDSLRSSAEKVGLAEVVEALTSFSHQLASARAASPTEIDPASREAILGAHERLVVVMPKAFTLEADRAQRESIIVHSLLMQIPGVRKIALERLYAAGLHDVAGIASARPDELARVTGIEPELAERVVERFRAHRAEIHAASPDAGRTRERNRLAALASELAEQNAQFERASAAWTPEATEEKKRLRQARERTVLEIGVLLARLGEIERLRVVERLPFDRKLEELTAFLKETQGPPGARG
jgi:hypothetical protein